MNIAYLINGTYNSGGMERVLSNKTNFLINKGYEVTIITTDQMGRGSFFSFSDKINWIDLDINYSETNGQSFFYKYCKYLLKTRKHKRVLTELLCQNKYDIVISMFGNEVHWLPRIKDRSKKIAEIHFSKFFREQSQRNGLWRIADIIRSKKDEKAIKKFDKFVVLTNEDKQYWGELPNIVTIYNSTSFMPDKQSDLISKRAISLGRLTYQKGYNRMIQAWEIVNAKHPDWKLDIFGGGEDFASLQKMIEEASLMDKINILSPTKDVAYELSNSSLYILTSNFEGLPMVLIESMACGVPPVSFACKCGPKDIINNGVNGYYVEYGDIHGLAEKICEVIENDELRKQMGDQARQTINDKFSEEVVMKQWITLFKELTKINISKNDEKYNSKCLSS